MKLLGVFPIKHNRIVFVSFYGNYYSDNPKALSDKLKGQGYDLVWLVRNTERQDEGVRFIKYSSLLALYYLATAKLWVDNCRKYTWIVKRKNQYYLQMYHACIPFKCVEGDAKGDVSEEYILSAKHDSEMADFMISNSNWCTSMIRRAFWFDGKIIESGTPRMDVVINCNDDDVHRIKKNLGINENVGVILYAPTFRNSHTIDVYNIDFKHLIAEMTTKTGKPWVVMLRLHFGMVKESEKLSEIQGVLNVTKYDNLYELLCVSDYFITDYSTTMFESMNANKPVFIYAPDLEAYKKERSLYFEMKDLPFPFSENNDQLINKFLSFNEKEYNNEVDDFKQQLNVIEDGKASARVADYINLILSEGVD